MFGITYYFNRIQNKWRTIKNRNLKIGNNVKIAKGVVFDTSMGGTIEVGDNTEILNGCLLMTYGGSIKIGLRTSINPYTIIYGHGNTTIGNDVLIAGHCMIIPSSHIFSSLEVDINKQGLTRKGIIIEDNVWVAHKATILDGVTIENGSIIAAGAVVTDNVLSYTIVGGIPAKLIKKR
jgi:acetyltransferase-like isoleucine patch superfamily enzyme